MMFRFPWRKVEMMEQQIRDKAELKNIVSIEDDADTEADVEAGAVAGVVTGNRRVVGGGEGDVDEMAEVDVKVVDGEVRMIQRAIDRNKRSISEGLERLKIALAELESEVHEIKNGGV
jgi:hypothetical protein